MFISSRIQNFADSQLERMQGLPPAEAAQVAMEALFKIDEYAGPSETGRVVVACNLAATAAEEEPRSSALALELRRNTLQVLASGIFCPTAGQMLAFVARALPSDPTSVDELEPAAGASAYLCRGIENDGYGAEKVLAKTVASICDNFDAHRGNRMKLLSRYQLERQMIGMMSEIDQANPSHNLRVLATHLSGAVLMNYLDEKVLVSQLEQAAS